VINSDGRSRIEWEAAAFKQFNAGACKAISLAIEEARTLKRKEVDFEDILLGLLAEGEGIAARALGSLGISLQGARLKIEGFRRPGSDEPPDPLPFSVIAEDMLKEIPAVAKRFGFSDIGTEHLLLGLIRRQIGGEALVALGVNLNDARVRVLQLLYQYSLNGSPPASETPALPRSRLLDEFGQDLIRAARDRVLDQPIGRQGEMRTIMQILLSEADSHPLLIGHRGVGMTSIIHGVANSIAGRLPSEPGYPLIYKIDLHDLLGPLPNYYDKRSRHMALTELLAGIPAIEKAVIVVDNALRATGVFGEDVYPITFMQPVLDYGQHRVLATATPVEYAQYLTNGGTLVDFFQAVEISELDAQQAIEALRAHREPCEMRHQVVITDEAIEAAVTLSSKCMPGRSLPGKALDLLDEAAAQAARHIFSRYPPSFNELEDKITTLVSAKHVAIDNADFDEAAKIRVAELRLRTALAQQREEWTAAVADPRTTISKKDIAEAMAALLPQQDH
jgi:ATP-dependent Clp protease ATP-binding subunit ClpC